MHHVDRDQGSPLGAWLTAAAFLVPLAINIGDIGGKPVDFILSDIWLLIAILAFPFRALMVQHKVWVPVNRLFYMVAIAICYFTLIGLIGALYQGGSLSNVISMLRFVKQFLFILAGSILFGIYREKL
jgi:hypothetical protein